MMADHSSTSSIFDLLHTDVSIEMTLHPEWWIRFDMLLEMSWRVEEFMTAGQHYMPADLAKMLFQITLTFEWAYINEYEID